jgi:dCTP deaminase
MTILAYQHIKKRCMDDDLISPCYERTRSHGMTFGLGPAGYDIRTAEPVMMIDGGFCLVSSIERFSMPDDLLARVCDKSTLARRGLFVQNTVIEPGWRGYLTLELTFHGTEISLDAGAPIAQIVFEMLSDSTEMPYEGKYQDQEQGAQPARRDLI